MSPGGHPRARLLWGSPAVGGSEPWSTQTAPDRPASSSHLIPQPGPERAHSFQPCPAFSPPPAGELRLGLAGARRAGTPQSGAGTRRSFSQLAPADRACQPQQRHVQRRQPRKCKLTRTTHEVGRFCKIPRVGKCMERGNSVLWVWKLWQLLCQAVCTVLWSSACSTTQWFYFRINFRTTPREEGNVYMTVRCSAVQL